MFLKLLPDNFANAKTMKDFLDTNLKTMLMMMMMMMMMIKIVGSHIHNFVISSQNFHIKFVKGVINLKNS